MTVEAIKTMELLISQRNTRDWSKLPSDFEYRTVKATFESCKPYFCKDEIRQRVNASKAQTFAELHAAIS